MSDIQGHSDSDRRFGTRWPGLAHGLALAKEVKAPVTLVNVTQAWAAFEMAHEVRMGHPEPMRQFEDMARDDGCHVGELYSLHFPDV